jgi:oxygen-independent coproporphyrinogen-3 oxidase
VLRIYPPQFTGEFHSVYQVVFHQLFIVSSLNCKPWTGFPLEAERRTLDFFPLSLLLFLIVIWVPMRGLYIHIPFCIKKCSYCDFYSVPYTRSLAEKYVHHLLGEIELFCRHAEPGTFERLDTLYIGGGTPSCLEPIDFRSIIRSLNNCFDTSGIGEFTIEVNPGTLSTDKLAAYKEAGVNRISIGAQTFNDRHLKKLGRFHNKKDIHDGLEMIHDLGFTNVNIDLIFGIPLQSESDVIEDVAAALGLSPTHISAYALSIEEGTPLFEEVKGGLQIPSDDDFAACYRNLEVLLQKEGFLHYEISNFALRDFECTHNIGYWTGEEYLAFGAGASGHLKGERWPGGFRYRNHPNLGKYIRTIERGQLPRAETLKTDVPTAWKERLIMGLRLTDGICLSRVRDELGNPPRSMQRSIEILLDANLLQKEGDVLKIPRDFLFTSNEILARLV